MEEAVEDILDLVSTLSSDRNLTLHSIQIVPDNTTEGESRVFLLQTRALTKLLINSYVSAGR